MTSQTTDIVAEDPNAAAADGESAYITAGDLIAQLQQYDSAKQVRILMRETNEDEGQDEDAHYPVMYTEEAVDSEPESPTHGTEFIALVCDLRDEEDDFEGNAAA